MDRDSDFGFGGNGDDNTSFTPSLEEEEQQQDEDIVRNPSAIDNDSDFGFGGNGDDDASFTPSLEEEQKQQDKQQDENIVPATVTPTTGKRKWRRFSLQEKLCLLRNVRRRINNGSSQAAACRALNVHEKQVIEWKKQFQNLKESSSKKAKSLCKGRSSILVALTDPLLSFIFELRETCMAVSINMIVLKAAHLSRPFREKSSKAQYHIVNRFVKSHGMVHMMGTHVAQKAPSESMGEAHDYMEVTRPKMLEPCHHQDYVLNMNQTPVPFGYDPKSTLELIGRRTVHVRKSTSDTKRATLALTVTASGKALIPLIVFKRKPNGRIVTCEFPTYPEGLEYACQDNTWMDERVMLLWVEKVLKPYVEAAPDGIIPILFLDSYRCHMMSSVVDSIQALGVEVEHIPGGCTYLCQPVDVGINKPFKKQLRDRWESWMVVEGIIHGTTSPPMREKIAEWAIAAKSALTEECIKNVWRHGDYSWFPEVNNSNT